MKHLEPTSFLRTRLRLGVSRSIGITSLFRKPTVDRRGTPPDAQEVFHLPSSPRSQTFDVRCSIFDVRCSGSSAFTLTELLFVTAIMAILAAMLLPVLGRAMKLSQAAQCMNNEHQLARSWLMYANDNQNILVPNRGLNGATGVNYAGDPRLEPQLQPGGANADWCPGNLQQAFDTTPGIKYPGGSIQSWWLMAGLLYPYINDISIYKCPADVTTVPRGATVFDSPALRTYSMNDWVQPMDKPGYSSAPWNGGPTTGYYVYTRLSNMTHPGPSKIFVFIEEAPYSIDDGFFAVNPSETTAWVNSPAVLHGHSSELAYADGHVEPRRWTDRSMISETPSTPTGNTDGWPADPTSGDLAWLISVATAPLPP